MNQRLLLFLYCKSEYLFNYILAVSFFYFYALLPSSSFSLHHPQLCMDVSGRERWEVLHTCNCMTLFGGYPHHHYHGSFPATIFRDRTYISLLFFTCKHHSSQSVIFLSIPIFPVPSLQNHWDQDYTHVILSGF